MIPAAERAETQTHKTTPVYKYVEREEKEIPQTIRDGEDTKRLFMLVDYLLPTRACMNAPAAERKRHACFLSLPLLRPHLGGCFVCIRYIYIYPTVLYTYNESVQMLLRDRERQSSERFSNGVVYPSIWVSLLYHFSLLYRLLMLLLLLCMGF